MNTFDNCYEPQKGISTSMILKKVPGWMLLTPKAFIFDPDSPDPLDQLEPEMFQVCWDHYSKMTILKLSLASRFSS